jgi:hypothetical protein
LIEKSICPRPLWGGERGKENDRVWIIWKYLASVYENSIMKHTENWWIIE